VILGLLPSGSDVFESINSPISKERPDPTEVFYLLEIDVIKIMKGKP